MELTVETGSGSSTADSYISLTDAATRHTNLGNTAWAALATDAIREQYLRRATEYMEGAYKKRWKGYRKTSTQSLSWPRTGVYLEPVAYSPVAVSETIVPNEVKNACADLALKAATVTLAEDLGQAVVREKIDVIEIEYDKNAPAYTQYRAIDMMLATYLKSGGKANIELVAS